MVPLRPVLPLLAMPETPPYAPPPQQIDLVNMGQILQAVAERYSMKVFALRGPGRHPSVARPRMIVMYLARKLTSLSFPEIGAWLGGRNHSTVISGCRKIEALLQTSAGVRAAVRELIDKLGSPIPFDGGCVDA